MAVDIRFGVVQECNGLLDNAARLQWSNNLLKVLAKIS